MRMEKPCTKHVLPCPFSGEAGRQLNTCTPLLCTRRIPLLLEDSAPKTPNQRSSSNSKQSTWPTPTPSLCPVPPLHLSFIIYRALFHANVPRVPYRRHAYPLSRQRSSSRLLLPPQPRSTPTRAPAATAKLPFQAVLFIAGGARGGAVRPQRVSYQYGEK